MKEYFESVDEKRANVIKETNKTLWSKSKDSIDPLDKWKEAKKNGLIKPLGYEPEPSKSSSKTGVNIIIPINPIGIPKYDAGERFDIRLPYAERGYEDPDADVMGKFVSGISSLFGIKKKENNDEEKNSKKNK
mmetsp:Transcript_12819/g.11629  ORF Transcript_12819/g.11629 Transcript_12819/m.11629 type:complete len:133 (+) Transcript_12819:120-518(+)